MINAPFTPDQVKALEAYQANSLFHPYTCWCGEKLEPHKAGLYCPLEKKVVQTWAMDFTLDPNLQSPAQKEIPFE